MLLIHGVYHFRPSRVGFRNDYCLSCEAPRLAVQVRTLDVVHVYWIPFLPLGFWKHWACSVCGKDPHRRVRTARPMKWIGATILLLLAVTFWALPPETAGDDEAWMWGFRIGAPVALLLTLVHLARTRAEPGLKERLAQVAPATTTTCPFCSSQLFDMPDWHCPRCGVRRL
jgi:hypothetical protein